MQPPPKGMQEEGGFFQTLRALIDNARIFDWPDDVLAVAAAVKPKR